MRFVTYASLLGHKKVVLYYIILEPPFTYCFLFRVVLKITIAKFILC